MFAIPSLLRNFWMAMLVLSVPFTGHAGISPIAGKYIDIEWDDFTQQLYAINDANELRSFDLQTGELGPVKWKGQGVKLIQPDGAGAIYVGFTSKSTVSKVNLMTGLESVAVNLETGHLLEDLHVISSFEERIAVTRILPTRSPQIVIYEKGVRLPNVVPNLRIGAVTTAGDRIYTIEGGVALELKIDSSGVKLNRTAGSFEASQVTSTQDGLVSANGFLMDYDLGIRGRVQGEYGQLPVVLSTPARNLAEFLSIVGDAWVYQKIALQSGLRTAQLRLPPLLSSPVEMFPVGNERVGFRTEGGEAYFIELTSEPKVDLEITREAIEQPVIQGSTVNYRLTVKNLGAAAAERVLVTELLEFGSYFKTATASKGLVEANSGLITASIGQLAPGETATMDVSIQASGPGVIPLHADTFSSGVESNPQNNRANAVLRTEGAWTGKQMEYFAPLLHISADRQNIYGVVQRIWGVYGRALIKLNPVTGEGSILRRFAYEPDRVEVSPNGRFVWVVFSNFPEIEQIDLHSGTVIRFPHLFKLPVGDMDFLGEEATVILATGSESRVFDNGVPRPTAGPAGVVSVGSSGVFQYQAGTGVRELLIRPEGIGIRSLEVNPLEGIQDIANAGSAIVSDTGIVFSPVNGRTLGALTIGTAAKVIYDPIAGRIVEASHNGSRWSLKFYDPTSLRQTGEVPVNGLSQNPTNIVQFGSNLFALRTGAWELIAVDASGYPTADLILEQSFSPALPTPATTELTYTLRVTNQGPERLSNVVTSARLTGTGKIVSAMASGGANYSTNHIEAAYVVNTIPTMGVGESLTITIKVQPTAASGIFLNTTSHAFGQDPNLANNRANSAVVVPPPAALHQVMPIRVSDFDFDRHTGKFALSVWDSPTGFPGGLYSLNPATFVAERQAVFPSPGLLEISAAHPWGVVSTGHRIWTPFILDEIFQVGPPITSSDIVPYAIMLDPHGTNWALITYLRSAQLYSNLLPVGVEVPGTAFTFGATKDVVFGYDAANGVVTRYNTSSGDFVFEASKTLPFTGPLTLTYVPNALITSMGHVIEPTSLNLAPVTILSGMIVHDPEAKRVYSIDASNNQRRIGIYNDQSLERLGTFYPDFLPANLARVRNWGRGKLAGIDPHQSFHLLDIPDNGGIDLILSRVVAPASWVPGVPIEFQFNVRNAGPWLVANSVLEIQLPSNFVLADAGATGANAEQAGQTVNLRFTELTNGQEQVVRIRGHFNSESVASFNLAFGTPQFIDADPSNDQIEHRVTLVQPARVTVLPPMIAEGNSATRTANIALALSARLPAPAYVRYELLDGSVPLSEVLASTMPTEGLITIQPSAVAGSLSLLIKGDRLPDPDKTILLRLFSPTGLVVMTELTEVTIVDDDTPNLLVARRSYSEKESNPVRIPCSSVSARRLMFSWTTEFIQVPPRPGLIFGLRKERCFSHKAPPINLSPLTCFRTRWQKDRRQ